MIPRFASAAAKLMATLGETGSYTVTATATAIPLRMLIDRDITTPLPGMQGTVLDRRTVLTATAADLHAAGITRSRAIPSPSVQRSGPCWGSNSKTA